VNQIAFLLITQFAFAILQFWSSNAITLFFCTRRSVFIECIIPGTSGIKVINQDLILVGYTKCDENELPFDFYETSTFGCILTDL